MKIRLREGMKAVNQAKKGQIPVGYDVVVQGISVFYREPKEAALSIAEKKLKSIGLKAEFLSVHKRSVDARKKENIQFVYSVLAHCCSHPKEEQLKKINAVLLPQRDTVPSCGTERAKGRIIVVGFGPCGMFAALTLAQKGYRPLIIERGESVFKRKESVESFLKSGKLNENSNIQFGAGGAGTFSDGKLVTRVNDPLGSTVLETLYTFGAPENILTLAKPHIGTDRLLNVVERIQKEIELCGGEFLYNTRFIAPVTDSAGKVTAVLTSNGQISCAALILAIGHSARDTYKTLLLADYPLVAKDFSVGARVEHLQEDIDYALYGDADISLLGHGEYTLSHREENRGVYSFCMCPGGQVICASSEEGGLVVNGMSNFARDGKNANSAIAVSVLKEDYGSTPLSAIEYQEKIERTAFLAGGGDYSAPIQTLGDFLCERKGSEPSRIQPTFRGGKHIKLADLSEILPKNVVAFLRKGFPVFEKKIKGFSAGDAILTGVETRTSAPIRILRGEDMTAIGHDNIYPCGEGAGYAGGITSAAIDGMRVAYKIIGRYRPED